MQIYRSRETEQPEKKLSSRGEFRTSLLLYREKGKDELKDSKGYANLVTELAAQNNVMNL